MKLPLKPMIHPHTGLVLEPIYVSPKTGRKFWPILGASDDDPSNDPDDVEDDPKKTFTQAEVTEIMAREKRQGKRAGQTDAWKVLGFDSEADAKTFVDAQREAAQKSLTEQERRDNELTERERRSEQRERETAAKERLVDVKSILIEEGAKGQNLIDALMLLNGSIADDDDLEAVAEAATALKARRSELFGKDEEEVTPKPKGVIPAGRPGDRKKPDGQVVGAVGLDRARRKGWTKD